jgi:hypothetical protein
MSRATATAHAAGIAVLLALPVRAQVAFPVTFDPSAVVLSVEERMQIAGHLQEAGRRWIEPLRLDGPRSLEIQVVVSDVTPRATGQSLVSVLVDSSGGRDTYEQGAAHELRTGADQNGTQPDIRITINPVYLRQELWFDPDPAARAEPVPMTRTDALSVLLHELGHALAYNGWADAQGTAPAQFWSTFDRWMLAGVPVLFDGGAVQQQYGSRPELTSSNVHHWANAQTRVLKATRGPPAWANGAPQPDASCEGLIPAAPPSGALRGYSAGGLMYELMNGVVFYRGTRYQVSALDRAALVDAGLPVDLAPVFDSGFE